MLALISAIAALLLGAFAAPADNRFQLFAAACIAFALWLVIGLKPAR